MNSHLIKDNYPLEDKNGKRLTKPNVAKMWSNWNFHTLLTGKLNTPLDLQFHFQARTHTHTCSHTHTRSVYQKMCMVALVMTSQLETTQVSINRWTDKQNVVYTCNGIGIRHKKEGNSSHITPQMNLDIMLSEINFSPPKTNTLWFHLWGIQSGQIQRNKT